MERIQVEVEETESEGELDLPPPPVVAAEPQHTDDEVDEAESKSSSSALLLELQPPLHRVAASTTERAREGQKGGGAGEGGLRAVMRPAERRPGASRSAAAVRESVRLPTAEAGWHRFPST